MPSSFLSIKPFRAFFFRFSLSKGYTGHHQNPILLKIYEKEKLPHLTSNIVFRYTQAISCLPYTKKLPHFKHCFCFWVVPKLFFSYHTRKNYRSLSIAFIFFVISKAFPNKPRQAEKAEIKKAERLTQKPFPLLLLLYFFSCPANRHHIIFCYIHAFFNLLQQFGTDNRTIGATG